MSISILFNGERKTVSADTSVRELVARVAGSGTRSGVAVAIDDRVVPRSDWDNRVADGARVEILTAVQGG